MKPRRRRLDAAWLLLGVLLGAGLSLGYRLLGPVTSPTPAPAVAQRSQASEGEPGKAGDTRRDRRPQKGAGEPLEAPWRLTVVAGRILVSDPRASVVMAVDPTTGDRTDVFGTMDGRRVYAGDPVDVAAAPDGGLYVIDIDQQAVLHSKDGNVRVVSGERARGQGPALDLPVSLGVLPGGRLLVLDHRSLALFQVDPKSGDRRLLSGDGAGGGPPWLAPGDLAITADGRAFVLDTGPCTLVEVDPRTGARSRFMDLADLTQEGIWNPLSLSLGGPGELLVTDLTLSRVVAVDVATRTRKVVADPLVGAGPRLTGALDAVRAPDGALIVSSANGSLSRVAPDGTRSVLSGREPGRGPVKLLPTNAAIVRGRAVVCDPVGNRLLGGPAAAPLRLGEMSGERQGTGPRLRRPHALEIADGAAIVLDRSGALMRVDVETGDRTLISGEGRGSGPLARNGVDPVVAADGSIYVLDRGTAQLLRVDPKTGDRRAIRLQRKDGGLLVRGRGLTADQRVLWIWTMTGIHEVDPATGTSTRVETSRTSDAILTPGPSLALPNGIMVVAAQDLFGPGKVMRRLADGEWRTLLTGRPGRTALPGILGVGPCDAADLGDVVLTGFGGQGLFVLDTGGRYLTRLEPIEVE